MISYFLKKKISENSKRIEAFIEKQKEFIENKIKAKDNNNSELIKSKEIGVRSKTPNLTPKNFKYLSDDFFKRQEKYERKVSEKIKQLKDQVDQKELSEVKNEKKYMEKGKIEEKVNALFSWNELRKNKINQNVESLKKLEVKDCSFKPVIDKNSVKMVSRKYDNLNKSAIIERLNKPSKKVHIANNVLTKSHKKYHNKSNIDNLKEDIKK